MTTHDRVRQQLHALEALLKMANNLINHRVNDFMSTFI